jgi:hypothetical protein
MSNIFLFHRFNRGVSTTWKGEKNLNNNNFSDAQVAINQKPDMTMQLPRTPFKPNPLKLYRRGRTINLVESSKPSIHIQDIPNGYSLRNDNTLCNDTNAVINSVHYEGNKNLKSDNPTCDCIRNEPYHSKKILQHKTILDKKYYTRHEDMRKARGQTFLDRQFKNKDDLCCSSIDKPNNSKYHVQGAVDAGTRLERLKLEAIQSSKNKYLGNYIETYNDKSKLNHDNCKIYRRKC